MKYFLDTEFLEDGKTIELISIGVVCEDGREYYAVNEEAPWSCIVNNDWLRENVCPHLPITLIPCGANHWASQVNDSLLWALHDQIRCDLLEFVTGDNIEFWGYYPAYDWVAVCRLFGRMIDLPGHWPKFCYDLRQWLNHKGLAFIRQPDDAPHQALLDARWGAGIHNMHSQ